MLAASRTARVPGRITFLIVSINTIKGIRAPGVPWGTRCANMCWVWFNQPYTINAIHKGIESDRVIVKCLVLVKIYGKSPKLLLNTINENKVTKIIVPPTGEEANKILNSPWRVVNTLDQSIDQREGIIQYKDGINKRPIKVESQLRGRCKIEDMGSKTENKLVIIFNLFG